jgi:hypothetical protein
MWHRVDVVLTDVSEERIASIFRVERKIRKSASEETVRTGASRLMLKKTLFSFPSLGSNFVQKFILNEL